MQVVSLSTSINPSHLHSRIRRPHPSTNSRFTSTELVISHELIESADFVPSPPKYLRFTFVDWDELFQQLALNPDFVLTLTLTISLTRPRKFSASSRHIVEFFAALLHLRLASTHQTITKAEVRTPLSMNSALPHGISNHSTATPFGFSSGHIFLLVEPFPIAVLICPRWPGSGHDIRSAHQCRISPHLLTTCSTCCSYRKQSISAPTCNKLMAALQFERMEQPICLRRFTLLCQCEVTMNVKASARRSQK